MAGSVTGPGSVVLASNADEAVGFPRLALQSVGVRLKVSTDVF